MTFTVSPATAGSPPPRLLLVEDHADTARVYRRVLVDHGYAVVAVATAAAAQALCRSERFDLLLVDIGLPGVDGLDLLAGLRAAGDHTPALALSAHAREEDRQDGLAAGFIDYLVKPLMAEQLIEGVARVVGPPPNARPLRSPLPPSRRRTGPPPAAAPASEQVAEGSRPPDPEGV